MLQVVTGSTSQTRPLGHVEKENPHTLQSHIHLCTAAAVAK